ncbi:MAG: RNA polymerase sigma factor [Caldilineaceae bacterium]
MDDTAELQRTLDAIWRIESAKIIAVAARIVGDIGVAEEVAQDAVVNALERWPETGLPENPGAWLMTAAKRRAVDRVRRGSLLERKHVELGRELETQRDAVSSEVERSLDAEVEDDLLRLIFTACHPILSADARVALTLRVLGGLTTEEIARAFLISKSTAAQRIVRAKRMLAAANVPFEAPQGQERAPRLASVLEVLYLIFNEGYAATSGDDWIRPALCEDALRLGRILAELAPEESEVHGLVALMEIQASRLGTRVSASGEPILLMDQDRIRWDRLLIGRGLAALARARALNDAPGPYRLQAEIAACHARALSPDETDWPTIAALYGALSQIAPSPVVELNRAVAVTMAYGPDAGLAIVDTLVAEESLQNYHLLPSVRGDLLAKLERYEEARAEFERAAALTDNVSEQRLLLERAKAIGA